MNECDNELESMLLFYLLFPNMDFDIIFINELL